MRPKTILILFLIALVSLPVIPERGFQSNVERNIQRCGPGMRADAELPSLAKDNTPGTGTTGGVFIFSANFTDNVGVTAVRVNFTYNGISFYNLSMDDAIGEMWNRTITVDVNATEMDYHFFFNDSANNTNATSPKTVQIIDTIPPVADAGADRTAPQGRNFFLDGSNSTDNIGIFNFTWYWWCNGCGLSHEGYGQNPLILGDIGYLTVYLNVTDAEGNWDTDSVNITMIDIIPPIANAGDDVVIEQHETVTFNGSDCCENFEIVNYTWSFPYNDSMVYLYGRYANFTFDLAGEYPVELAVEDEAGNTGPQSSDTLMVSVLDITSPVAFAGTDVEIDQHESVIFNGSFCYDNLNITEYLWNFTYGNKMQYMFGPETEFTFHDAGRYKITLNVSDDTGNRALDSMMVTVRDITDPVADPGADQWTVNIGEVAIFDAGYSTDNIGIVNYTWNFQYNGTDYHLYGTDVTFSFFVVGNISVTLTVRDAEGNQNTSTFLLHVADTIPPVTHAGPDILADAGTPVLLNASGTRDHSPIASYSWIFSYNGSNQILTGLRVYFRFNETGTYNVLLIVRDVWDNVGTDTLIIEVGDLTAPSVEAGDDMNVTVGETVVFEGYAHDNVGVAGFEWRFLYNDTEQVLYGESAAFVFDIPGNYTVELWVNDEAGNIASHSIWVNVTSFKGTDTNGTDDDDDDVEDDDTDDDDNDDNDDLPPDRKKKTERRDFFLITPLGIAVIVIFVILIGIVIFVMFGKKRTGEGSEKAVGSEEDDEGESNDEPEGGGGDLEISEDLSDSEDCDESIEMVTPSDDDKVEYDASKDMPAPPDDETMENPAHGPDPTKII